MKNEIPIVPALIPDSQKAVVNFTAEMSFVHEIHIDVVDGEFVPAVSWPVSPADSPLSVKSYTDRYTLEVDLMVKQPLAAALLWEQAGADMIVFHVETISPESFSAFAKRTTASVGIAFHGATTIETIKPYVAYADYIQIMGIETIGAQGQAFSEKTLSKIETLKVQYPHIPISVDGSVNKDTIKRIVSAGADRVIVGSAISHAEDKKAAYDSLRSLLES